MTDKPILFSAPMVRALLDGRKTMTRRVITPSNFKLLGHDFKFHRPDMERLRSAFNGARGFRWIEGAFSWLAEPDERMHPFAVAVDCRGKPKFAPGDRLWVRETWAPLNALTHSDPGVQALADLGFYRADDGTVDGEISRWQSSIHMPRRLSRLTLIVTDVRVERLQDISEDDAIAEGTIWRNVIIGCHGATGRHVEITADRYWHGAEDDDNEGHESAVDAYIDLWDHINGEGAWEANPWVTVTTFTVHRQNIDQMEAA